MLRTAIMFLGLAAAAPVAAANYAATLASPSSGRFITSDISWNCGAAACQGSTEESRPLVLCQSLAKRAGRIETFLVDGRAFDGADLERCNAAAKAQGPRSLAAQ